MALAAALKQAHTDVTSGNPKRIDLRGPVGIAMGAEGSGLRRLTREHCDYLAAIPMAGSVSSLNVSVACAVTLYEAFRQRRAAPGRPGSSLSPDALQALADVWMKPK